MRVILIVTLLLVYNEVNVIKNRSTITEFKSSEFTLESFYSFVNSAGFKFPDIVIAQAILETGNFKSDVFKLNNNLFGMKHPTKRKTLSLGSNKGYAKYKSWEDSVLDFLIYCDKYLHNTSDKDEYLNKIETFHSRDSLYREKIETIINKNLKRFSYAKKTSSSREYL